MVTMRIVRKEEASSFEPLVIMRALSVVVCLTSLLVSLVNFVL